MVVLFNEKKIAILDGALGSEFSLKLVPSFCAQFSGHAVVVIGQSRVQRPVIKVLAEKPVTSAVPKSAISIIIGVLALMRKVRVSPESGIYFTPVHFHFVAVGEQVEFVEQAESFAHFAAGGVVTAALVAFGHEVRAGLHDVVQLHVGVAGHLLGGDFDGGVRPVGGQGGVESQEQNGKASHDLLLMSLPSLALFILGSLTDVPFLL